MKIKYVIRDIDAKGKQTVVFRSFDLNEALEKFKELAGGVSDDRQVELAAILWYE